MLDRDTGNTAEIGSSAEQLTSQVNEHILAPLAKLHEALEKSLAGHAHTLGLYKWLYDATKLSIERAACAIDEEQHVIAYIANVVAELKDKKLQYKYKQASVDLIDQLVELYKAIMQVCVRAGRNLMLAQDDISTAAIVLISNQIENLQFRIENNEEGITEEQERIKRALAQFNAANALENHPGVTDYRLALTTQLNSHTKTFQPTQFGLLDEKEDPAQEISKIEAEIARLKRLVIVEVDIETDLLANSPQKKRIERQIAYLHESERAHWRLLTAKEDVEDEKEDALNLTAIVAKAENIKTDLERQKEMIETLSKTNHFTSEMKNNIEAFEDTVKKSNLWWSKDKAPILVALNSLTVALLFVEAMSISHGDELRARKKDLQARINNINIKFRELNESKDDAKLSQAETAKLVAEFGERQRQATRTMPALFAKQKQTEKRLVEEQLDKAKSAYIFQLEMRKRQCKQKINEQNHYHFKLPSARPFAFIAGISGVGTVGTAGIAIAAFAVKVAALAFVASNPVGWIVGLTLGTAALLTTASVLGTKGYNRYKKNKLLKQHENYEQEELFKQNQILKEQKISTTTRHLMMRHGIKIKPDSVASVEGDVACYVVGKEYAETELFFNVGRKQLFFGSGRRPVSVAKDATEFRTQVKRYSAPAA